MTTKNNGATEALPLLKALQLEDSARSLNAAINRQNDPAFRILLTGEYNRGKSSVINAILGEAVLATSLLRLPIINTVKGGDERMVRVEGPDGWKTVEIGSLSAMTTATTVELTWDDPLFKDQIEIVEYPSMTEPPDEGAFQDWVENADLIVVVVAADALFSNTESQVVETIFKPAGHKKLIFIANFTDRLNSRDLEDVKTAAAVRLPVNPDRIFFLSAFSALNGDEKGLHDVRSIIGKIREDASRRDGFKTERTYQIIQYALESARQNLEDGSAITDDSAENEAMIRDLRKYISSLRNTANKIEQEFNELRDGTRDVLLEKTRAFLNELSYKVEDWATSYQGNNFEQEINQKIKDELKNFVENEYSGYLRRRIQEQHDSLSNHIKLFQLASDELYQLLGVPFSDRNFEGQAVEQSDRFPELQIKAEETTPDSFDSESLLKNPNALITLIGTLVVSVLFKQLALFLAPTGLFLTAWLMSKSKKSQKKKRQYQNLGNQIKARAGSMETEVIKNVKAQIGALQDSILEQLEEKIKKAQSETDRKINALETDMNERTKRKPEQYIAGLQAIMEEYFNS